MIISIFSISIYTYHYLDNNHVRRKYEDLDKQFLQRIYFTMKIKVACKYMYRLSAKILKNDFE